MRQMASRRLKQQSKRKSSILSGQSNLPEQSKYDANFRISFEYLDKNQGQSFKEWNDEGLLLDMLETISCYCKEPVTAMKGKKFKEYGEFPVKSGFEYPKHVEEDVNWGSLHINGRVVLGGFISGNTFFVVFLDKNHEFWKTEKKHT